MELERTHTQLRDPNTREHGIDNYDNNEQNSTKDGRRTALLYNRHILNWEHRKI